MQFADNGSGLTLVRFDWFNEMRVEIPNIVNGKPVTEIGSEAFKYCYADEIVLPENLTRIADRAFEGCAYLIGVKIPESCTEIGAEAFSGCEKLASIDLPSTVRFIGKDAFAGVAKLQASSKSMIMLGDGILYAYRGSGSFAEIPEGVKIIGASVFEGNTDLKSVSIPSSVHTILDSAFAGCKELGTVDAKGDLAEIGADAFAETDWLESSKDDYVTLGGCLVAYKGKDSVAEVPDSVHSIGGRAFAGNAAITTLRLPDAVTRIGRSAFEECTSLQVVTLGEHVTEIGDRAFFGCKTLHYLRLGHALDTIGSEAFVSCPALQTVYLPDTVKTVGDKAFGYSYNAETAQYDAQTQGMTLYANAVPVLEYARAAGIAQQPLPETENTEPAPEITTVAGAADRIGSISGSAWMYAAAVGGVLLLAGIIGKRK